MPVGEAVHHLHRQRSRLSNSENLDANFPTICVLRPLPFMCCDVFFCVQTNACTMTSVDRKEMPN